MIPWLARHPAKRCTVIKKNGKQCKNPKAFGCKTCRYHGARRIETGIKAPNYKHGAFTKENQADSKQKRRELYDLHLLGLKLKMINSKPRGRPPEG